MGLINTLDVKVWDRKVDLHAGAARRGIGRRRVLQKLKKILQIFCKIRTFSAIFQKMRGQPSPSLGRADLISTFLWTYGYAMESLVTLALTGTKCIKSRKIDKQTNKQTNKLSPLYIEIHVRLFPLVHYVFSTLIDHE